MTIKNSTFDDISEIFRLYELATDLQKTKIPARTTWPKFSESLISTEINEDQTI